ncbi:Poly [ADP-ribose] polymerase [Heracleum sosnowskyi]|uniref:Poly [ADP-ribose] polymerase n=1 Tax=Heracleum sosnowskyi TaxID=360622 RepID=A0AAD8JA59_9APIA|nr:Poly [ADP-ribose] polymerase [Heracleum sosnowskyi]
MEQDQVSITEDNCEILAASSECSSTSLLASGTIRVGDENRDHDVIKNGLVMGMGKLGQYVRVVEVRKNLFSGLSGGQGRMQNFRVFSEAVSRKNGGDSNLKYAWYGGSKKEISDIINHGFACVKSPGNGDLYGRGVYLSPVKFPMDSVLSSGIDNNGLRHILLCRVILGKTEQICAGSEQFHPSSEEFDTGVDNLEDPKKYIVWSCYMNSHILPHFVVSFKAPSMTGLPRSQGLALIPKSPYLSFPKLVSDLKTYLIPSQMALITKSYTAFLAKKITRNQLISTVRQIVGDNLLKAVIQSSRNKTLKNKRISGA